MAYKLGEYHASEPDWRERINAKGRLIGIELEVESSSDSRKDILECLPDITDPDQRPLTETDSSLDYDRGVEIVFPPVPYTEIVKATSVFGRSLRALRDIGVRTHDETGMHMNVNAADWPESKVRVFCSLMHSLSSTQIFRIGGRMPNDYCWQDDRVWDDVADPDESGHSVADVKYNHSRIELRFPKATTNINRVRNLIRFITLAEQWAITNSALRAVVDNDNRGHCTGPAVCKAFLDWLRNRNRATSTKILDILEGRRSATT